MGARGAFRLFLISENFIIDNSDAPRPIGYYYEDDDEYDMKTMYVGETGGGVAGYLEVRIFSSIINMATAHAIWVAAECWRLCIFKTFWRYF